MFSVGYQEQLLKVEMINIDWYVLIIYQVYTGYLAGTYP